MKKRIYINWIIFLLLNVQLVYGNNNIIRILNQTPSSLTLQAVFPKPQKRETTIIKHHFNRIDHFGRGILIDLTTTSDIDTNIKIPNYRQLDGNSKRCRFDDMRSIAQLHLPLISPTRIRADN